MDIYTELTYPVSQNIVKADKSARRMNDNVITMPFNALFSLEVQRRSMTEPTKRGVRGLRGLW